MDEFDKIREESFKLYVKPTKSIGSAPSMDSIIKVLNKLNSSYKNFIKIEFLKDEKRRKANLENSSLLESVLKESELLIVDLNYSSFDAQVSSRMSMQTSLFGEDINDWKTKSYKGFRDDILLQDFTNADMLQYVDSKYTKEEKHAIFHPLFSSTGSDYSIVVGSSRVQERKLLKPNKRIYDHYVPKLKKIKEEPQFGSLVVSFNKDSEHEGVLKRDIKKIHGFKKLSYSPDIIKYDNIIYDFKKPLISQVKVEEGVFIIENNQLDIIVWGDSMAEAEKAFQFSFHSIYDNYVNEDSNNLSKDAKELQNILKSLINKSFKV